MFPSSSSTPTDSVEIGSKGSISEVSILPPSPRMLHVGKLLNSCKCHFLKCKTQGTVVPTHTGGIRNTHLAHSRRPIHANYATAVVAVAETRVQMRKYAAVWLVQSRGLLLKKKTSKTGRWEA